MACRGAGAQGSQPDVSQISYNAETLPGRSGSDVHHIAATFMNDTLGQLARLIEQRKGASADSSYVASLFDKGLDAILKKVGEESAELIIAAKNEDKRQVVHETADLWFHTLVVLAAKGLAPEDVMRELEQRFGVSGLQEKANRSG